MADRAAIRAAWMTLERFDHLDRAQFGGACDASWWECGGEDVGDTELGFRFGAHGRDEVRKGRVGLDLHHVDRLHAADLCDSTEIIAHQIDDHRVLGALFFIGAQRVGFGPIIASAPREGALDGACFDDAALRIPT